MDTSIRNRKTPAMVQADTFNFHPEKYFKIFQKNNQYFNHHKRLYIKLARMHLEQGKSFQKSTKRYAAFNFT